MESYRKLCLKRQTELRSMLADAGQFHEAIDHFLHQHAMLHSAKMAANKLARTEPWSFEDAVLDDMAEDLIRRVPQNCEHSVAWIVWHVARCEDVTMNLLVAGSPQVLDKSWLKQIKSPIRHTGNEMDVASVADFSAKVDIESLRVYRVAVGRRTREIVKQLGPADLKQKVDPVRLQRVMDEGAVIEAASYIADYWGKRDTAGLLLMPASRHHIVHFNEALKLKKK